VSKIDYNPVPEPNSDFFLWRDKLAFRISGDYLLYVSKKDNEYLFEITEKDKLIFTYQRRKFVGIKQPQSQVYRDLKELVENGIDLKQFLAQVENKLLRHNFSVMRDTNLEYFLDLPDWEINGVIHSLCKLEKERDGKKKVALVKIYLQDGNLSFDLLERDRFIPPETALSTDVLQNNIIPDSLSIQEIYYELRKKIQYFVLFNDDVEYDIDTCAAIASFFREVFETYPIIDYYSNREGSGKTRAMKCLIWASYHGFVTPINVTEAVLFRAIEDAHCSIGIDEFHKLFVKNKSGELNAIDPNKFAVINCGYSKGIMTYRINMESKPPMVEAYENFSLKAITRLKPIPADLLSRCVTHVMLRSAGRKKIAAEEPHPDHFRQIRDKVYILRLFIIDEVFETYKELLASDLLKDRTKDLFYPILTIAKLVNEQLFEKLMAFAKEYDRKMQEERDPIVECLLETMVVKELYDTQPLKEIANEFNIELLVRELRSEKYQYSSRRVATMLRSLGFNKSSYRKHNLTHFDIDLKTLLNNVLSFFPDILTHIQTHTSPTTPEEPNFLNFPNQTNNEKDTLNLERGGLVNLVEKVKHYILYRESQSESKSYQTKIDHSSTKEVPLEHILDITDIIKKSDKGPGVTLEQLKKELKTVTKSYLEQVLNAAIETGYIYVPNAGRYKLL